MNTPSASVIRRCRVTTRQDVERCFMTKDGLVTETRAVTAQCWRMHNHTGPCDFDPPRDPYGPDGEMQS